MYITPYKGYYFGLIAYFAFSLLIFDVCLNYNVLFKEFIEVLCHLISYRELGLLF